MKPRHSKSIQRFISLIAFAIIAASPAWSQEPVGQVWTGLDEAESEDFRAFKGKWIGVITNHTGVDSSGRHIVELLCNAPGVKLAAIFSPEHGLDGRLDEKVASGIDAASGLPVYSLYGDVQRPDDKMLDGLDALVFDIQDAGVRFYTYITTMAYAMEAAAIKGVEFYVLDRPNPVDASVVEGPVQDEGLQSFTAYFPMPVRHGMTVGELAFMFNAEYHIGAKLRVVPMRGYRRTMEYKETGLLWPAPSPNLRTVRQARLYPGVALLESANVSVGRGTATPFELVGAPWIDGDELTKYLSGRNIDGVRFIAEDFVPWENRYRDEACQGVRIVVTDDESFDPIALGVEMAAALYRLYPDSFLVDKTISMFGARQVVEDLKDCASPESIACGWQPRVDEFRAIRAKYLLY